MSNWLLVVEKFDLLLKVERVLSNNLITFPGFLDFNSI